MKKPKFKQFMRALNNYIVFFLIVAFVVSCCMMLFVTVLADSMGLVFTRENIADAAKPTFGNVILINLLFGPIDYPPQADGGSAGQADPGCGREDHGGRFFRTDRAGEKICR